MRMEHRQASKTRIAFPRLIFHTDVHRKIDCRHVGEPDRESRTIILHTRYFGKSLVSIKRERENCTRKLLLLMVMVACRVVEKG